MIPTISQRPRNVDAPRAAAILYGDWGTSKAYVIGLAFAVGGYGSFWLIAAMCLLTALAGLNYIIICKHYPDGGGVYASVRHRSHILSIVGAFLLIADYMVTASLSALSAFQYLGQCFNITHPEIYAAIAIGVIGALNFFGPRHTGGLAFLIAVPTVAVVVILGLFSLPHLGTAVAHLQPMQGGFWKNWGGFVGVVLALSGVEAIGNATGVMKLNPDSTPQNPSVTKTSTPAIVWVMIEVCLLTALLGLAMHALPGLVINKDDVDAPGHPGVRDYMLRYMAEVFVGGALGPTVGMIAAWAVSIVVGFLLLSAVNTAIVDLIAISFLMSRDGEIPSVFQKLNSHGVPTFGMIAATVFPLILVLAVKDMSGLAELYAIGVVGAIATNLGASSTDFKLGLSRWERSLMFFTFLVMLAIEISLFVDKPNARAFAMTVLAVGLIMRGLAFERAEKKKQATLPVAPRMKEMRVQPAAQEGGAILVTARGITDALNFAVEEAALRKATLYVLYVRVIAVSIPTSSDWRKDMQAAAIFQAAGEYASDRGVTVRQLYATSDDPVPVILDLAATFGVDCVVMGGSQRSSLINLIKGDVITEVARQLPSNIRLLIYG